MLKRIKDLLQAKSIWISILVTIGIAYLSLAQVSGPKFGVSHLDKIEHALAYFVLTFCWLVSVPKTKKFAYLVLAICFLYGVLIEVLQAKLTTYRYAEYADEIANSIGVVVAYLCFLFLKHKKLL